MKPYLMDLQDRRAPYCTLLSYTACPLQTLWIAWHQAKDRDAPTRVSELDPQDLPAEELRRVARMLLADYSQVPEFVQFSFVIHNLPRALLDQLVRHRLGSFFAQSLRVVNCEKFATDGDYFIPSTIFQNGVACSKYRSLMFAIEERYRELLELGIPIEDARGVLPLHINTQIAVAFKLRDLVHVVGDRMCELLQAEYWGPLLQSMKLEIERVDPVFGEMFKPPCESRNKCVSENEAFLRLEGKDPNKACGRFRGWMERNGRSVSDELRLRGVK